MIGALISKLCSTLLLASSNRSVILSLGSSILKVFVGNLFSWNKEYLLIKIGFVQLSICSKSHGIFWNSGEVGCPRQLFDDLMDCIITILKNDFVFRTLEVDICTHAHQRTLKRYNISLLNLLLYIYIIKIPYRIIYQETQLFQGLFC